jgi:hypothetical protein
MIARPEGVFDAGQLLRPADEAVLSEINVRPG